MGSAAVRPMTRGDLPEVVSVCNAAFGALRGDSAGAEPMFPTLLFETRFAADPTGCLVAADSGSSQLSAALISVARGTMGWFGPLAVRPEAQRGGLGEELVATYLDLVAPGIRKLEANSHSIVPMGTPSAESGRPGRRQSSTW